MKSLRVVLPDTNPGSQFSFEGTIAWEYWDGAMVHEITDNDYNDIGPSLHGSMIAWVGRPPGSADQIFYVSVAK